MSRATITRNFTSQFEVCSLNVYHADLTLRLTLHLVLIAEYLETITREVNGECRFTEHSPWLCCLTSESSYLVGCCIKTYGTLHRKDVQGDSAPRVLEWVRTFRLGRRSFCCVLYLVIETSERLGRHQIKTLL